jgi:hypothetical protein
MKNTKIVTGAAASGYAATVIAGEFAKLDTRAEMLRIIGETARSGAWLRTRHKQPAW